MNDFSQKIISWYKKNKRDLPWRHTQDPYLIWLSEIIFQQTRIEQGMSYYLNFSSKYPTVKKLANAPEDEVMKMWQGLGYYSRARNLHTTAKFIANELKGNFPTEHTEVLKLKGVGAYTAAAIVSFAYNKPHAVVDGNVYRLLSRAFGIKTPIDSTAGKKQYAELAQELIDKKNPGIYNQAIMEFGSMQCKPANPDCAACPLNGMCYALQKKMISSLPVKEKKTKQRDRYFNFIIMKYKNKTILEKRTGSDIWKNLYQFPLIETAKEVHEKKLILSKEWKAITKSALVTIKHVTAPVKHILSHQTIYAKFIEVQLSGIPESLLKANWITKKQLKRYAVPRIIERYM